MKKQQIKSLRLNKKFVASMNGSILGGKAATCEGPCQGGTGCCNGATSLCVSETGGYNCNCMPRDH
ncbi:hypothetical protein [Kordia sp.]|uniref:hypothetical protein n=1 Tax=Kordia sp. TaxID=1965332 RepID=UPI003D6C37B1